MPVNRTLPLWILIGLCLAWIAWRETPSAHAQPAPVAREQAAIFSSCGQAPAAARSVESKANAWLSDHRTIRVLQREMFTAPCPGVTEYGSIAITVAIHYEP